MESHHVIKYYINPIFLFGDEDQKSPCGNFKCYMKKNTKDFFIKIDTKENIKAFTQSVCLNIFAIAKKARARNIYLCIRNKVPKKGKI